MDTEDNKESKNTIFYKLNIKNKDEHITLYFSGLEQLTTFILRLNCIDHVYTITPIPTKENFREYLLAQMNMV